MNALHIGNAELDGKDTRGWIIGNFMPKGNIRHSNEVEIKWAIHKAGEGRDEWIEEEHRTTVCILISGKTKLEFIGKEPVVLENSGDYVMWGAGMQHKRHAIEDCITLTVRWPSIAAK